jgi:hypothetical protein
MRRHIGSVIAGAVTGAALVTLGLAAPAAASAGRPAAGAQASSSIYTSSQAGFVAAGGRWFRYISATFQVPPVPARAGNAGYAELVLGGTGVTPAALGVKAGGGPASIGWNAAGGLFGMGGGTLAGINPAVGDLLGLSIYYNQAGHVFFTATDSTQGVSQTVSVPSPPDIVYTAAEAVGVVSNATVSAPASDLRLWALSNAHVTTYGGARGTLLGPWTTTMIVDTTTGTPAGALVTSPGPLWNGGQNFGVWLRRSA